ncbi:urea ABC transporter permease subunit UrtC [Xylanibacillus composti]|uniref:ABC transporter permease n=1 Tax=Xylanibacillus composti TaxID=1572762 RepID=A0A8J4H0A3_9BACL|nr:urea ABC transporter permease subunit UrtC [Xylanibacillus composti]MDT9723427.1 urea ABC transporter permease subunit UrtC [Xylanibacillus composti]GIQ68537.1 ABC transporter permease [Xylanibacillus composti]
MRTATARFLQSKSTVGYLLLAAALLSAPLFVSDFRLNLLAKFLSFAILAIGLDLIWGYTGILSLGQGVFFGLGAYCMAMHLKLGSTDGKLPDFMSWSGLSELPWFWQPFHSFPLAVLLGLLLPAALAVILGYVTFRSRIRGVYFSILTQALVLITVTLFVGQQAYTGGTNGVTGFRHIFGYSLSDPDVQLVLYLITAVVLIIVFLFAKWLVGTRFARALQAIRDGENRLRFIGYNPDTYKMVVFALSAALAGLAGMLFVLHVGIISPSMMGIVPSIEMVLWVAIGGRGTLIGAVLGAILINAAKTGFSEAYPDGWLYFMGALFVIVVVFLPGGMMSLKDKAAALLRLRTGRKAKVDTAKGGGHIGTSGMDSILRKTNR